MAGRKNGHFTPRRSCNPPVALIPLRACGNQAMQAHHLRVNLLSEGYKSSHCARIGNQVLFNVNATAS